jgi:hypothetical protein
MLTTDAISTVRITAFASAGAICGLYAFSAYLSGTTSILPDWSPLAAGALAALAFSCAAFLAGPQNTNAALDESYFADKKTAASAGFWAALFIGTAQWLTGTGGAMQLATTLTGASAVYLLTQAALDLRGRRCA